MLHSCQAMEQNVPLDLSFKKVEQSHYDCSSTTDLSLMAPSHYALPSLGRPIIPPISTYNVQPAVQSVPMLPWFSASVGLPSLPTASMSPVPCLLPSNFSPLWPPLSAQWQTTSPAATSLEIYANESTATTSFSHLGMPVDSGSVAPESYRSTISVAATTNTSSSTVANRVGRKHYPLEFKRTALEFIKHHGVRKAERYYGVALSTLQSWVRQAGGSRRLQTGNSRQSSTAYAAKPEHAVVSRGLDLLMSGSNSGLKSTTQEALPHPNSSLSDYPLQNLASKAENGPSEAGNTRGYLGAKVHHATQLSSSSSNHLLQMSKTDHKVDVVPHAPAEEFIDTNEKIVSEAATAATHME